MENNILTNRSKQVKERMQNIPGWLLQYGIFIITIIVILFLFISTKVGFSSYYKLKNISLIQNSVIEIDSLINTENRNFIKIKISQKYYTIDSIRTLRQNNKSRIYLRKNDKNSLTKNIYNTAEIIEKKNMLQIIFKEFLNE